MTSLIDYTFQRLKEQNKTALIPFLTANFPTRTVFLSLLDQLPQYGADIIEIGIPFSDPQADGTVIQQASHHAIAHHFHMKQCLSDIAAFKQKHPQTPLVAMTYANPVMQYGWQPFFHDAHHNGLDGVLMVDMPPQSNEGPSAMAQIRLITPTTTRERLTEIQHHASGFLYYVAVKGVTGTQTPDAAVVGQHITTLRPGLSLPLVIGFGINNAVLAAAMAPLADGLVVGSALLKPFLDVPSTHYNTIAAQQLTFLQQIKTAILTT